MPARLTAEPYVHELYNLFNPHLASGVQGVHLNNP